MHGITAKWGPAEVTVGISAKALEHQSARAGVILLGSFLLSFAFIRMSARLMRSPRVPWATARFERQARRLRRWQDWIGGAPSSSRSGEPIRADACGDGGGRGGD